MRFAKFILCMVVFLVITLPVSALSSDCPADIVFNGEFMNDAFGRVANAGDFNNDGYDDIIVSAINNDESFMDAGKVYVFSGKTQDLLLSIRGETQNDHFGEFIAGLGDFDYDGFDDIIVGAPQWGPLSSHVGRVYIFLGNNSTNSQIDAFDAHTIIEGTTPSIELGWSFCWRDALLYIGAPGFDNNRGKVFCFWRVILASGGHFDQTHAPVAIEGTAALDWFGHSMANAGDINNDEFDDIVVGAGFNDAGGSEAGRAYVFFSPTVFNASDADVIFTSQSSGENLGQVTRVGDLNFDGINDIVLGAPCLTSGASGAAYVFYGSASMSGEIYTSDADLTFLGESPGDQFGISVSGAGDFNRDGFDDIAIGESRANFGQGRFHIFSGETGEQIFSIEGESIDDNFGLRVAGGGDCNNDGWSDVIVGAIGYDGIVGVDCGKAYLYFGKLTDRFCDLTGETNNENYGHRVSGGGDADNDGFDDLLIGARNYNGVGVNSGRAYLVSGQTGETLYIFDGEDSPDIFGNSVSWAGDVNDDDFDDLIIGASGYSNYTGKAYVYSGFDGSELHTFIGQANNNDFGASVSGAGDVNNDGYNDVIIGALNYNNSIGRAYIYSGIDGSEIRTLDGESVSDRFGRSVSDCGDINKDGYADVIVGAHGYNISTGRAYIFSGIDGTQLYYFDGDLFDDKFGRSVSNAGDVNNDGYPDVIIGAYGYNGDVGRAYVYSGFDYGLLYIFDGENTDDWFGHSVSWAGDVDDDCYDDVLVGSRGQVYIYSGFDGSLLHKIERWDEFGRWVSGAGDVNNDNRSAIIVGSMYDDAGGTDAGRALVYIFGTQDICKNYVCGDANYDITVNVSDAVWIINYVFVGGDPPSPIESGDTNCDGTCNVSDAVWIINYVFVGGNEPCDTNGDTFPDC
jgi:FG-GAP repeat/Dockerin type I domain